MNHKQKSVRDYFLATLPNVRVSMLEDEHQLRFAVLMVDSRLSHIIIFDRDTFEDISLRDLFSWLHNTALAQTIKIAVTPLEITFKDSHPMETEGTAQGAGCIAELKEQPC